MTEREDIKIIETDEELQDYRLFLKKNPFKSNEIIYQGTLSVTIGKNVYDKRNSLEKQILIEDYFHPGLYLNRGGYYRIYDRIDVKNTTGSFNEIDAETWIVLKASCSNPKLNYLETSDLSMYNKLYKSIIIKIDLVKERSPLRVFMSDEQLLDLGFEKGKINKNHWFHKKEIKYIDSMLPYKKFDHTYRKVDIKQLHQDLLEDGYPQDEIQEKTSEAFKKNLKFGVESLTYSVFEGIQYTFGIEIETCIGRIPDEDAENLNVKAVHDGSLRDKNGATPGGEYVTGVLKGDSGLVQLHELCRVVQTYCKVNTQCGVHVHVGSLEWGKEDVIYSYILGELLEEELFSLLPVSRRDNSYCRCLTPITLKYLKELSTSKSKGQYDIIINELYNEVYKEVTYIKGNPKSFVPKPEANEVEGVVDSMILSRNIHKNINHPLGSKCGYDKNAQRYTWLNFVTLLYLTKGETGTHTLEMRNHSATMNFKKIKNWIKICLAFCKFVEIGKTRINTGAVTLEEVIMTVYPRTGEDLMKYINERKEVFKSKTESIDYIDEIPEKQSIKEVVCV